MKISLKQLSLFGVGVAIIFISIACSYENALVNMFIAMFTMLLCGVNLWKSRDSMIEFILHVQLFYYNYSVVFSRYLYTTHEYEEFYQYPNERVMGIGILSLCIFEICMSFFAKQTVKLSDSLIYSKEPNELFSMVLLLACFAIGIWGFDWSSYGERGSISTYYEYMGILLILGLHYSGRNRSTLLKVGYSLLIIFLVLQGFIYGERVSALQFMLIWFFYFLGERIKASHVIIICLIGVVLMVAIGAYRVTYEMGRVSIEGIFETVTERLFTFDGADLGYYCSLTFVMVAERISWPERIEMFVKFLQSILFGNSTEADLPTFTRSYYWHWYGGFYPLYFYFYAGIAGVIAASGAWCMFVYKCLCGAVRKNKDFFYLLGLYLVCITSRWYMYTPLSAVRPVLLFAVAYMGLYFVNKMIRKR